MGWKKPIKQTVAYTRLAVCGDSEKAGERKAAVGWEGKMADFYAFRSPSSLCLSVFTDREPATEKKISGNKYGLYLNPTAKQIIL